jgi:hypothetical protein
MVVGFDNDAHAAKSPADQEGGGGEGRDGPEWLKRALRTCRAR